MTQSGALSAERVRELLDYDPGTGVFRRRQGGCDLGGGRTKAGDSAGCVKFAETGYSILN